MTVLAIASDLHLQHTSDDAIRYSSGRGDIVECGVRRNVSSGGLRRWFAMIHEAVLRQRVDHVELVLAGDVFEMHRTPLWFLDNPHGVRPTQDFGPDEPGNPFCRKVHAILDAIEADNREFLRVLARFVHDGAHMTRAGLQHLPPTTRVEVHFLPGNHDRLANAWPSVRRRVRQLLAMTDSDAPFPHVLRRPNHNRTHGYGVAVRHGHEYDRWNFGGEVENGRGMHADDAAYLRPCIGDTMSIDIALRCAVAFRARYAVELRTPGPMGDRFRRLYLALLEFDDVRPTHALFDYLAQQRNKLGGDPLALLRPVIGDIFAQVCSDPFFVQEAQRMGVAAWFTEPVSTMVQRGINHLPSRWAVALPFVWPFRGIDSEVRPADMAQHEPGLQDGTIDTVVAGHTHVPDQVPIRGRRRRRVDSFFLDSGTWRACILYGAGERFGRICGHTVVFCFSGGEHKRDGSEGRRFETWTSHFAPGHLGPYAEPRGTLRAATMHLRFLRLSLDHAGGSVGAPMTIEVQLGVDGQTRSAHLAHVRPGESRPLFVQPVVLQPELDGELWLHGTRIVPGLWDEAVPLPWAVDLLAREPALREAEHPPRHAPRRAFVPGPRELLVKGRDGLSVRISYVIEPVKPPRRNSRTVRAEAVP